METCKVSTCNKDGKKKLKNKRNSAFARKYFAFLGK